MNEDDFDAARRRARATCGICLRPRGEGPIPAETDPTRATHCWLSTDNSVEIAEAAHCFDQQFHRIQADHLSFVEKAYARLSELSGSLAAANGEIIKLSGEILELRRSDRRVVVAAMLMSTGFVVAELIRLLW